MSYAVYSDVCPRPTTQLLVAELEEKAEAGDEAGVHAALDQLFLLTAAALAPVADAVDAGAQKRGPVLDVLWDVIPRLEAVLSASDRASGLQVGTLAQTVAYSSIQQQQTASY